MLHCVAFTYGCPTMQAYEWQCHICRRSNSAARDTCTACGFAAAARGEDILLKRAARAVAAEGPPMLAGAAETPLALTGATLAEPLLDQPLWRKVLVYSGAVVCGAGMLCGKFAWSMQFMENALLMMAGGALLLVVAIPWKPHPPRHPKPPPAPPRARHRAGNPPPASCPEYRPPAPSPACAGRSPRWHVRRRRWSPSARCARPACVRA